MLRLGLIFTAILALLAAPLQARDSGLQVMMTGTDSKGFEAVGRLNIGGKRFCTGALIAPDLVLTAAHCLYDADSGTPFPASAFEFLAGWRNGRATAVRHVTTALAHPDFRFSADGRLLRVASDLALLRLDAPVQNIGVTPFPTGPSPHRGDQVGVVSYAQDRADSPALQKLCDVLNRQDGMLVMNCDVDFGSSGAPVFMLHDGQAQIVSVISAKAMSNGHKISLGANMARPLATLSALMEATDPGGAAPSRDLVQTLDASRPLDASGARFVRP